MAASADYSIVPYELGRRLLAPESRGYAHPLPPLKKRMEGLLERWPDSALNGRSIRSSRPQPTYSSRRTIEDAGLPATGLMVDIFV
jgi:hypothetical protein